MRLHHGTVGGGRWRVRLPDRDAGRVRPETPRRMLGIFRPYRRQVAIVGVAILVTSILGVVNPLLIKVIFDTALFPPDGQIRLGRLYVLSALMLAIPLASGAIGIGQAYVANLVGQRVMQDLRNALYRHLQRMSLRFFTGTRTGEIQSRLSNDVGGVQTVVTETASNIFQNATVLVSTVVAMLILSWQLTILALFLLPVFVWLTFRVGRVRQEVTASTQRSLADISVITQETLSVSGILLSKSFGRQREETERFQAHNETLARLQLRQQLIGKAFSGLIHAFFAVTPGLVYLAAGLLNANDPAGRLTLEAGTIVAFTALQSRLLFPLGQMLQVSVDVQSSMALFQRVFEYLDLPQDIVEAPDARVLRPSDVRGHVRFRTVYFRYDPAPAGTAAAPSLPHGDGAGPGGNGGASQDGDGAGRAWTLEDVNLEIEPGRLAALVGPSGAGKTTMTYLVPRLYDVVRGAVEIDGIDVRSISLQSLGSIVGMVTQETYLLHTTVGENLRYGRPDATDEEIEAASRAAFIHDRILELPDGYRTVVGERGYRLSGGEKQRLAIARVLLKDPKILILDEATSSLDTTSERLVQQALRPLMRGRTTIAIAHRLSTVLAADVIFVLDRGRVVERGTHEELLRAGGLYARLYEQQFRVEGARAGSTVAKADRRDGDRGA